MAKMETTLCAFLIVVLLWGRNPVKCMTYEKEGIRLDILRQKTPTHQLLEHGHRMWDLYKGVQEEILNGKRDNDSIALYRFLDHEFYGKIVMGHPGQTINVALDTSWSYTWVLSAKCSSIKDIGCWFHDKYDHGKSSQYKPDGRPFVFNIGKQRMAGIYSYENISIAHSNVTNQSFIEMVEMPNDFILNKASGVLGLGIKIDAYMPFFYTLLKQKKIKNPLFSVFLNRDPQSNRGGNVMLGFVDSSHVHKTRINNKSIPDNITYLQVDDNTNYWRFKIDQVIVDISKDPVHPDAQPIHLCKNGCKGIPDTSVNTIIGPQADIDAIHDAINAREFFLHRYTVDCDTVNKLPTIMFVINGQNFNLTGPSYISKISYHYVTLCVSAFVAANTAGEGDDYWYLGGAFLTQFYSVYNVYDRTIGFVKSASAL